jgi:hypothetical protein
MKTSRPIAPALRLSRANCKDAVRLHEFTAKLLNPVIE